MTALFYVDPRPPHDPATCRREPCGRCRESGVPSPPRPVDHDVKRTRRPVARRELDLGRRAEQVGQRLEAEGQAAAQHFYEWEREERQAAGSRGGGYGGAAPEDAIREYRDDRAAARLRRRWLGVQARLDAALGELEGLLDQAKTEQRPLDKHRTPAQVEADGWCGAHWHATKALVPVTLRPTGEPYYKGRCRFCGSWPDGDPPADVLRTRSQQAAAS